MYGLDSAELTTGAWALGIVHAPGSPTYMLLGHLFARLPIGDVGYRLNLMSAAAAALAILLLFLVVRRITGNSGVALAGSWFAAFTYYFWVSAVAAELYALHAAFVAGVLVLVLRWRDEGHALSLCLAGLVFGLGAGNHLAMALLLPGFAYLVASGRRTLWRPRWLLLAVAGAVVAGASVYLYLPLRYLSDTPLNYARAYWHVDLSTARGLLWMVSARMFGAFILGVPLAEIPAEMRSYGAQLWSNFLGFGCLLGVIGIADGLRRWSSLTAGLLLLFAGHLVFYLAYRVGDKQLMMLPTFLVWSIWVAAGAQALCRALDRGAPGWSMSAQVLLLFLAVGAAAFNFQRVDLSADWSARERGEQILGSLAPNAVYFGTWMDVPILEYLQIVEDRRPDVGTVNVLFTGSRSPDIARRQLREGRPVYTSVPDDLAAAGLVSDAVSGCDCHRVRSDAWDPSVR